MFKFIAFTLAFLVSCSAALAQCGNSGPQRQEMRQIQEQPRLPANPAWYPAARPSQTELYRVLLINEKSGKVSALDSKSAPVVTDESVTIDGKTTYEVLYVIRFTRNKLILDRDECTVAIQAPGQSFELYPATSVQLGSHKPRSYRLMVINELTTEVETHVVRDAPRVQDDEFSYEVNRNLSINGTPAIFPVKRTIRVSREKHSLLVQPLPPRSK